MDEVLHDLDLGEVRGVRLQPERSIAPRRRRSGGPGQVAHVCGHEEAREAGEDVEVSSAAVSHRVDAHEEELLPDVGVPVVLDLVVCAPG